MEPIASFSGLASGIQWRTMIDQIMAVEARPAELLRARASQADRRMKAWTDFKARVQALSDAAAGLASASRLNARRATVSGIPAGSLSPLSVSASQNAAPASYAVRVNQLATQEKLGGSSYAGRTGELGLAGEFLINGRAISVQATDSLDTIAKRINDANSGTGASGVSAAVLPTAAGGFRLVLTSTRSGAAGIDLRDGAGSVLHSLGLLENTLTAKHLTSNGARSDTFADSTTRVAELLGLQNPPGAASLNIGGRSVTIDLANQSLEDIRNTINDAMAGSSVSAAIVSESVNGATTHRLQIANTTNLAQSDAEAARVAELLGLLSSGRGSVASQIQSGLALTDGDGDTPITGDSLWQDVWLQGTAQAAGVTAGDRLTVSGRYDGMTFSFEYSIANGATIDDLLAQLNGAEGFNGRASATLSSDGRIVVTDNTAGDRRLSLSIVTHNDGGGSLDFGESVTTVSGRTTVIEAGRDAEFEIDGTIITRAGNTITDVIDGLTLNLTATSASAITVTVGRDDEAAVSAIHAFIDAYNALEAFVDSQLTPPVTGGTAAPLYSNGALRAFRSSLRSAMEQTISPSVAGAYTRLANIGSEIDRQGSYGKNVNTLRAALQADAASVIRLLSAYGATTSTSLVFETAGSLTQSGEYAVVVTQPAAKAVAHGIGFAGAYTDDGVPDRMIVRDLGSNREYEILLEAGATVDSIAASLNAEFARARSHSVSSVNALYSDATGTAVTDATTWAALHDADGQPLNVAASDVITISGTRPNGSAFTVDHVISSASTGTIGELRAAVQAAVGPDVDVALADGVLTATDRNAGMSLLSLALSVDGSGALDFGGVQVTTLGRGPAGMTASVDPDSNQLRLGHVEFGTAAGFEISFVAGGADSTAQLGMPAGVYTGTDVQGTIGGLSATGNGAQLIGSAGTAVEGLILTYTGAAGAAGSVTFSRGIAAIVENAAKTILGSGNGSIELLTSALDSSITQYNERIETLATRLERRREVLIRRFTAMEQAMARAQSQSSWLAAQFAQFEKK